MKTRLFSLCLALWMVCGLVFTYMPFVWADDDTIYIQSADDFDHLAKQCTLDAWSEGKTVYLMADLDFSDRAFTPIPTFGGTFCGNGFTIHGIQYEEKGSYKGVFRYIAQGGKISDLHVKGKFLLNGSKSYLGGIAGENAGIIEKSTFDGSLKGENVIGGIAGHNTEEGRILSCAAYGSIIGENATGGIAGKNGGAIQNCTNHASVNTWYEEKKTDISEIETDAAAVVENLKNNEEENREESVLGHTDTGGIAGFTSGIMQGCTNHGAVGYAHIGYNVGGVAGRQSGYILGCQNEGFIQGRKDVGGIVGQAEPYILLHASEKTLHDVKTELDRFNDLTHQLITDTDRLGDETRARMDGISKYTKDAQDHVQSLMDQGTDFADDNLAEINAQAAILSNTLDQLVPVFDHFESGSDDLGKAMDSLSDTLDQSNLYAPDLSDETEDIASALSMMAKSEYDLKKAATRAKIALGALEDSIVLSDSAAAKAAVSDLSAALGEMITAKQAISDKIDEIEAILNNHPDGFEEIGLDAQKIAACLQAIGEETKNGMQALKTAVQSLESLAVNTTIDFSEFRFAAKNMQSSIDYLSKGFQYITKGLDDLGEALSAFAEKTDAYLDDLSDEMTKFKDGLTDSLDTLSLATDELRNALGETRDILSDLAEEEPLEFVKPGDEFKDTGSALFDSLSEISNEIDGLKNHISDEKEALTRDITAFSDQFNQVLNTLIDEAEDVKEGAQSLTEVFVDVSDEEIDSARQGKIEDCQNSGSVEADRNVGGIGGNIAIEYTKDPEDDIEKPDTLNFTYRTKAILQGCVNDGHVKGKKDCVGGIVGKAEIGTVYTCENYGDTESTNGSYIGGIVGKSDANVRKSYAKGRLNGKRYIGGIAGKGHVITSCYAIVGIEGEENLGAVCGEGDIQNMYQNFYVDRSLGAVDGISYQGRGEAISYDELKANRAVPSRLISFTVTFVADDQVIRTMDIPYGEETKKIPYPDIPKKEGYFGKWQTIEADTVSEDITVVCDYLPYITILASEEKNESGKLAVALAEGAFTDEAVLHITERNDLTPPERGENVKVYRISLNDAELKSDTTMTYRLLNENKDKVKAWQLRDGRWEALTTSNKGKYVVLQADAPQSTLCIKYDPRGFQWGYILIPFVLCMGLLAFWLFKKRKRKIKDTRI